jgi:hypothetical protein
LSPASYAHLHSNQSFGFQNWNGQQINQMDFEPGYFGSKIAIMPFNKTTLLIRNEVSL